MVDNEQTTNQAAADEPTAQEGQASKEKLTDEIFSELTVLANRFVDVVQQAWNSEDRKRMEADLKKGLNNVAMGLEEGFQKVTENEKAQKVLNRADEVADDVGGKLRSSEAANDLAQGLVRGLRSMATILEGWSEEMNERAAQKKDTGQDDGQDIPIDKA